jgi:hypothetical protein
MDQIFNAVIEEIESRLTKLGIYISNVEAGAVPVDEEVSQEIVDGANIEELMFDESKIGLYITTVSVLSDIAWSDRVLNPSSYEDLKEFKKIAPSEFEIDLQSFQDDIMNWEDD